MNKRGKNFCGKLVNSKGEGNGLDILDSYDCVGCEMNQCPHCGRNHTGICGIPAGVTLGFGARVGGASATRRGELSIKGKPKVKRQSVSALKEMLITARGHEKKITDMLKVIPPELPEYDDLMDRLGKLEALILQLNYQIIERESK